MKNLTTFEQLKKIAEQQKELEIQKKKNIEKMRKQKSVQTKDLLPDLKLTELKLKHYPKLKLFVQGAYKKQGDLITLYSYETKIMDYNAKTGEIRRYYGITKEANAKIKELTRNGDLETLKDYKKKYWSYTTGMHIAEFSQQFIGEKFTKAKFEALEHQQDKEQPQHDEPLNQVEPKQNQVEPKLVASPNPQQIEMFCDYVPF